MIEVTDERFWYTFKAEEHWVGLTIGSAGRIPSIDLYASSSTKDAQIAEATQMIRLLTTFIELASGLEEEHTVLQRPGSAALGPATQEEPE